jgi:hypothetical protein
MHGDIFYPTAILRALLPTDVAMTWSFMVHVFLAGFFTFGLLRAWGLGFFPSLFGGVGYMMSGPIAAYVSPGHDGKLYVSALLPLALWFLLRGIRDGWNWAWGALALVIGLAVVSPHPQLLQYLLLACGAFALYIAFATLEDPQGRPVRLDRHTAFVRLGFALGAVLLGGVMGAIQYLPVREYVPYSPRAGGLGYDTATTYSLPIEELINVYLPQFSGILDHYWGRNRIHLHSEYLGVVTLMLAGAGLTSERRSFRWFWVGTLVVSLLWALGGNTPFYHLIYAVVPGTRFFRAPSTMLFVFAFSVAVLAALGLERLLAGRVSTRYAISWLVGGGVVALLASVGAFTNLAKVIAASYAGDQLDDMIVANNGAVMLGAWRSLLVVLLGAGLILSAREQRLSLRLTAWLAVALAALDLFSIEKQYWMFSPPASVLYASDPAIDYVRSQTQPGRVISFAPQGSVGRDAMLAGDGLMIHNIRLVLGYHGNELGRYQQLSAGYNLQTIFSPPFWRHENVRFLYTNIDSATLDRVFGSAGIPRLQRLVGPVKDASGTPVYLYRIPGENPFAWTASAFVKATPEQTLPRIIRSGNGWVGACRLGELRARMEGDG